MVDWQIFISTREVELVEERKLRLAALALPRRLSSGQGGTPRRRAMRLKDCKKSSLQTMGCPEPSITMGRRVKGNCLVKRKGEAT
jgi:hypothetical protein